MQASAGAPLAADEQRPGSASANVQPQGGAPTRCRCSRPRLAAERDAYQQSWRAEVSQKLAEQARILSDARENLNKAELRRQLVELRAQRDATVLTVARVSVGSVLQSGDQFITLVPTDVPLEVESNIAGRDDGFVHVGDPVAIKFDTFPYHLYGMATGTVRTVSPDSFTGADEARSRAGIGAVPMPQNTSEPFFKARIAINEVKLHSVPAGFHIAPGMPVTADIKVGKRTVLNSCWAASCRSSRRGCASRDANRD
jgi:hemolysin D